MEKDKTSNEMIGIIRYEDLAIVPYNHWKMDNEWLLVITNEEGMALLVPVTAIKLDEALNKAVKFYRRIESEEEDL